MKAGCIDLGQLNDPKYIDLVNKICYGEYGRKWSKMKRKDKTEAVLEILQDPSELDERLAGTNFNFFLSTLSDFVGGGARQQDILAKQLDIVLKGIDYKFVGEEPISKSILAALNRGNAVGKANIDGLQEKFWDVYGDFETQAFEGLEKHIDPKYMDRPFLEFEK